MRTVSEPGSRWIVCLRSGPIITYAAGTAAFGIGAYLMIGPDLRQTIQRLPSSLTVRKAGAL